MKIPKQAIEFIVNRFHVGTLDAEIAQDIRRRARHNVGITEAMVRRMASYALKVHHANQDVYNLIMGGF